MAPGAGCVLSATLPTIAAQVELQPISLLLPACGGTWRHVPVEPLNNSTLTSKIPERFGVLICLAGSSLDLFFMIVIVLIYHYIMINQSNEEGEIFLQYK